MSKLKILREKKGLSRTELAEISGVGVRSIEGYEQGLRDINKAQAMTVYKIAEALGCNVSDILEFNEE